ncbi:glycosyltransferase [Microbacterium telephonicum]|uniref:Glycosyltransferase involved in cell wall biosynthesis n=1 Tax=Microbacterium telephonicum TaxID=1714841 RepID=A0A498C4J4_9MICO|nr:glycosyltransferase [Microbacterium telephonicum]RLK47970.1 glycosyltransferase involved in cell wall biosynthesis [Microbacterium telephonicum]
MPSVAIIGTRGYPSYYGGFETAVRKLAPYLVEQGWDVTVYSRPAGTRADDPGRDPRVRVIETRGLEKKSLSTLTYGLTAALHAAKEKPDVALVMNVANGFWLPILKRAGIPTLVNVDGIEWDRAKWGRFAKWVFHQGGKWTAKYGTRMVYDSHEIARRWKDEFGLDGEYIPYGGDPVDQDLPVEPGLTHRGYALVVARFVPENSIPEFLEAAPHIAEHTEVVIVGSSGYGGELDDHARALAATNPRIHWLGHVSDDRRLFSLWQHCAVYFHGHTVGGTNPALVQAMALGAPVVARDTPYNREVTGATGAFTDGAIGDIVATVSRLAASRDVEDASSALKQRARESFSWEAVNARYLESLRYVSSERGVDLADA